MHFIKYDLLHQTKHTYKIPTEGQKGVAATLRGLLLKSYSVTASSSLGCIGWTCLLYTSDAADEEFRVDLGGRRIIKKKRDGLLGTFMLLCLTLNNTG